MSARTFLCVLCALCVQFAIAAQTQSKIGDERAVARHLADGDEFKLAPADLVEHGRKLFAANWTVQDGAGRPLTKGTGRTLSDRTQPLGGLRAFNRISGPEANSCHGCHRAPFAGGSGDVAANVFELASRFDFVTFDRRDATVTRGSVDERHRPTTLDTVGNQRVTRGLFGAGYLEMAARQIANDLRRIRDTIRPGQSKALTSSGISFGTLARRADGSWDTHLVEGLPAQSLASPAPARRPSLIVRPWQQSASTISLRDITIGSFNQHHGMQAAERFGAGTDPDGDGVANELTRADITAVTVFEATLPVPGRVIPNDPQIEAAIEAGERVFEEVRCSLCHVTTVSLARASWTYVEPNPFEAASAVRAAAAARTLQVDLTSRELPLPRLEASHGQPGAVPVVLLPAYTDFKLHDITDPADATAAEPLDMNQPPGSAKFAAGNRRFLTRRLWGVANQMPYFHDGRFTTMRQAILAHAGEALAARQAFERAGRADQDALIEFLKSLQVLPPGTKSLTVDERFQRKAWPRRASAATGDAQRKER
jgi:hypothetical protein